MPIVASVSTEESLEQRDWAKWHEEHPYDRHPRHKHDKFKSEVPDHGSMGKPGIDFPIHTSNVDEAARLLGEGKKVQLNSTREVSTLLDKLKAMVDDAKAKGEKAPNYDLCKVSVPGTNLFCASSKGIHRIQMPQLSGKPLPGTKADKMKDAKGEADLSAAFRKSLTDGGVKVTDGTENAAFLKASQDELNGGKVAGMAKSLEAGTLPPGRIFISKDNYIVDGHHRWAANVAVGLGSNKDMPMQITRVDMNIIDLLDKANAFSRNMGIPGAARKSQLVLDLRDTEGEAFRSAYERTLDRLATGTTDSQLERLSDEYRASGDEIDPQTREDDPIGTGRRMSARVWFYATADGVDAARSAWDLDERNWAKWNAEHPWLKKGRKHKSDAGFVSLERPRKIKFGSETKKVKPKSYDPNSIKHVGHDPSQHKNPGASGGHVPHEVSAAEMADHAARVKASKATMDESGHDRLTKGAQFKKIAQSKGGALKKLAAMPKGKRYTGSGPMTDAEYKAHRDHVAFISTQHGADDLEHSRFSTHITQDFVHGEKGHYNAERGAQHEEIIQHLLAQSTAPKERKGIITGGLGGAGKSTILRRNAEHPGSVAHKLGIRYSSYAKEDNPTEHIKKGDGIGEPTNFLTLNPDLVKDEMIKRGMTPNIPGLSPAEQAAFIHEESSHITDRLAKRAHDQGLNVIHDVTLNSVRSGEKRVAPMKAAGYHVSGAFVDVSVEQSVHNAEARHRAGHDALAAGRSTTGGRYVPSDVIRQSADKTGKYRSANRAAFEALKNTADPMKTFDQTITVDNENHAGKILSVTGHPA